MIASNDVGSVWCREGNGCWQDQPFWPEVELAVGRWGGGGPPPHLDSPLQSILKHKFPTQGIRYALKLPDPRNATAVLIQMIT